MTRRWVTAAAAALVGLTMAGASDAACIGDCDASGSVVVNELVTAVSIGLDRQEARTCILADVNGDGRVTIDELIASVANALQSCPNGPVTAATVAQNYAAMLYANYSDSAADAVELSATIDTFLQAPSVAGLTAARAAWVDARPSYLRTEMARFYNGPIDNEDDGVEGFINAWPLDESYIDYVVGAPEAGIINDPDGFPDIDEAVLIDANEGGGETTISTGWHAIEFLLWGQDLSPTGPGNRPYTDYVSGGTADNQERRATYLRTVSNLLVAQLEQVRDAWADEPGTYRAEFLGAPLNEPLRRILTGLGTLSGGELTGERMATAFRTKDQEDEHSCFSDNTLADFREDERGIRNVFFGNYLDVHGPGIYDLVRSVNAPLADRARDAIQAAGEAIWAIPAPFDQAVLGADDTPGRQAIQAAINALNAQTDAIAECAAALGISISTTAQ